MPRHVAIIMDGNGRWAKQRFLPRVAGHRSGVEAVRATVRGVHRAGRRISDAVRIQQRELAAPADEVSFLMQLFMRALEQEVAKLHENGIRFKVDRRHCRASSRGIRELIADGESADRGQYAPDADRRGQLRRPLGHRCRRSKLLRGASGARARFRAKALDAVSCRWLRAGAGSVHPHRRRAAHHQFPAVAARVYRALFHRHAVARFRCGSAAARRSIRISSASGGSAAPASNCKRIAIEPACSRPASSRRWS